MAVLEKKVILNKKQDEDEVIIYPATVSDCIVDFEDKVPSVVDSVEFPTSTSPMTALEISEDEMTDVVTNALLK